MLHQIGIGTLGPVFRTYEPTRDRLVAVKVFRLDIVPEQAHALAAGLSRAARASLFHPSIVEPIEAGVEGTLAYRAEEYVAAESLDVAMRHYAPAPIERVLPFITQLSGAIDFARAAGIGHGGLHPRDIFVTPDEARATGFGVVDALEQVGIRAPIRRPYSAPERIDGGAWSTQADVFSLAAITFELLTGKRPSGTGAQIGALPEGAHAAALQNVLARAMDDDPSRRHASALAFAGALEAASQGRRITEAVAVPGAVVAGSAAPRLPVPGPVVVAPLPESKVPEAKVPSPDIVKPDVPKPSAPEPLVAAPLPAEPLILRAPPIVAPPKAAEPVAPTPGEFDIEAALDPVHEALDDVAESPVHAAPGERSPEAGRFAFLEEEKEDEKPGRLEDWKAGRQEEETHALEQYVAEQAEDESPAEAAMFHTREPELGIADSADQGRPAILPYAVFGVLMLLIGFAGGYFVGNRDRLSRTEETREAADTTASPAAPARATSTPAATTPSGAATPQTPGRFSEQKVTPPVVSAERQAPSSTSGTRAAASAPASGAAAGRSPGPPVTVGTSPAPTRAASKGQIVVRSLPSHAGVTVNGTWRGRTPLTLDDMAFGNYVVRVVQPGYKVARDEFTLSAREPSRAITTRLERAGPAAPAPAPNAPAAAVPASFTGSLYIDSRPRGATVTVDGKNAGQTPLMLPDVTAGSHVVRIEMEGKKPVTANPRITAGQTERVTVSLEDR